MKDSRFLRACHHQSVDVTPVWFMRQAGRSLPEYRKIRERFSLEEIVRNPDLCAEVTLQPVHRLGVDAAVMYSDIILITQAMGVDVTLVENIGPVVARPISSAPDIAALRTPSAQEAAPYMLEAIRSTVRASPVPVLGFSGAPFTLASYLIEGRPSRTFLKTKQFMYNEPAAFSQLLEKLAQVVSDYLTAQIEAGAHAVQLFDSWAGALSVADYRSYVLPHTAHIFSATQHLGVPRIHFGTTTAGLLEAIAEAGPDIVSVDWRVSLATAWQRIGYEKGLQGNLDPTVLLGPADVIRDQTQRVLREAEGRPGHVFNLGHGVLPETPVESLQLVVDTVHQWKNG